MSDLSNAPPPPNPPSPEEVRAWLEFEYTPLKGRCAALVDAIDAFLAAHPKIESAEVQGKAADLREQVRGLNKSAETGHDAAKAPFLAGGRAVDGWFRTAVAPIADPLTRLVETMNEYATAEFKRVERERQEAARIAREEADRKAEAAAATLAKTAAGSDAARLALADAQVAEEEAGEAEEASAVNAAAVTKVSGEFGGTASLRTTWRWKVVAAARIPRKFLVPEKGLINAAFKAAGRNPDGSPKLQIPGIESYPERSV